MAYYDICQINFITKFLENTNNIDESISNEEATFIFKIFYNSTPDFLIFPSSSKTPNRDLRGSPENEYVIQSLLNFRKLKQEYTYITNLYNKLKDLVTKKTLYDTFTKSDLYLPSAYAFPDINNLVKQTIKNISSSSNDNNNIIDWINTFCASELRPEDNVEAINATILYNHFQKWLEQFTVLFTNKEELTIFKDWFNTTTFGSGLVSLGIQRVRRAKGNFYIGIELKDKTEAK